MGHYGAPWIIAPPRMMLTHFCFSLFTFSSILWTHTMGECVTASTYISSRVLLYTCMATHLDSSTILTNPTR
jgi:hypothetical protein